MTKQEQIKEAAQCLLGINDIGEDWGYFEIEQFLDWVLDNLDKLEGVGYPMEVMNREHEDEILEEIKTQIQQMGY